MSEKNKISDLAKLLREHRRCRQVGYCDYQCVCGESVSSNSMQVMSAHQAEKVAEYFANLAPAPVMRAALVAIQELHPRVDVEEWFHTMDGPDSRVVWVCGTCEEPDGNGYQEYPCATRRLSDEALGGGERG